MSDHETYHHPSGHSLYISGDGNYWWHDLKGTRVASGSSHNAGHKVYDHVLSHAKRLTDNIRANELTHPQEKKAESKPKKKKTTSESTFSSLRKKLSEKDDIDTVRVPDAVPDFDMAEKQDIVPDIGLDDRLYTETEDDVNDKIIPSDVAVSGRLYTL